MKTRETNKDEFMQMKPMQAACISMFTNVLPSLSTCCMPFTMKAWSAAQHAINECTIMMRSILIDF